jgi:hypothetical protein
MEGDTSQLMLREEGKCVPLGLVLRLPVSTLATTCILQLQHMPQHAAQV